MSFMNNTNSSTSNSPKTFGKVLDCLSVITQVVFLILKCCGVINWDWVWVMSPTWTLTCFADVVLILMATIRGCIELCKSGKIREENNNE